MKRDPVESVFQRIELPAEPDGCWIWTGSRLASGYGRIFNTHEKYQLAHRIVYEIFRGPIPAGLTLDHLCRVRPCVNPYHLEPVPLAENVLRGQSFSALNARLTSCPSGHAYDAENTYVGTAGNRKCRACNRLRMRAKRAGAPLDAYERPALAVPTS